MVKSPLSKNRGAGKPGSEEQASQQCQYTISKVRNVGVQGNGQWSQG